MSRKRKGSVDPEIPKECPKPPGKLGKDARAVWGELAPLLYEQGLLTELDVYSLARFCQLQAIFDQCVCKVREEGVIVATASGSWKQHPAATLMASLSRHLDVLSRRFGLTPRDRQGLRGRAIKTPEREQSERAGLRLLPPPA